MLASRNHAASPTSITRHSTRLALFLCLFASLIPITHAQPSDPPSSSWNEALTKARQQLQQEFASPSSKRPLSESDQKYFLQLVAPIPPGSTRLYLPRHDAKKKLSSDYPRPLLELSMLALQEGEQALKDGDGDLALQAMLKALAFNPKQEGALHYTQPFLDAASERKNIQRADQALPDLGWEAGGYSKILTANFEILNHAPAKVSAQVADLCEQTLLAWQQVCFDYWSTTDALQRGTLAAQRKIPFRVVLFRNRQEFRQQLRRINPPENATGYYDPAVKIAFFFWDEKDDATTIQTIRHELIHQFFSEGGREESRLDTFHEPGMWSVEGIALYFESLTERASGRVAAFDLGGWDAPRLQSARYRRFHDQFWIPWNEFHFQTGLQWRENQEVALLYSQAAGLTHFLMDRGRKQQKEFMNYLADVYRAKPNPHTLSATFEEESFRTAYDQFLIPPAQEIKNRLPNPERPNIVLSRVPVDSQLFQTWNRSQRTLQWLDLSFTQIDDSLFQGDPWDVVRLSLEGTQITDAALATLKNMPRLEELDLSQCNISDDGMQHLQGLKKLKYLWLTKTSISDASIDALSTLKNLELLDVSETSVSSEGEQRLRKALPRWKVK